LNKIGQSAAELLMIYCIFLQLSVTIIWC